MADEDAVGRWRGGPLADAVTERIAVVRGGPPETVTEEVWPWVEPPPAVPPRSALPPQDSGVDPFGGGRFDPGRRGVRAIAAVVLVVAVGAGVFAWRARPQAEPVEPPVAGAALVTSTGAPGGAPGPGPAAASGSAEVVVAVAGKVRQPGLVRLPAGARVADAIAAAGGAQPGVDTALLNLARKLTDGELILVGVSAPPGVVVPGAGAPAVGGGAAPAAGGPVNLNTATVSELDTLPGVGPVLAERIIAHRDKVGGFRAVTDLREVEGVGDKRYEQLKDLVTV